MVAGMTRHMKALNSLNRDQGWIHTLLEEAENERMHLMTFMTLRRPDPIFRFFVLTGQGVFFTLYAITYALSPRTCHRFVGAVTPAPLIAKQYWRLDEGASIKDVVAAVRADEAGHRDVNHDLASERDAQRNSGNEEAVEKQGAQTVSKMRIMLQQALRRIPYYAKISGKE
ncbi:inducible alternative oxidase 2 [Borealophlyctis nickersoniae]|nr:inducible alternative oxidase 2 [Borealophlyctis nickersoniae]